MMRAVFLTVAGVVGAIGAAPATADVVREGSGARRQQLDAMELKAAPATWADLGEWIGGPVDGASAAGKPVLLVTWASWVPESVRALSKAQRLADAYGDQGLMVVGIHHQQGWEGAAKAIEERGVTFPVGHDVEGTVHSAFLVDNDPDYYLIDRAGQLRFADVAPGSVEDAVKQLVAESSDAAGNVNALIAQREAERRAELDKLTDINEELEDLSNLPEIPVPPQPESAYDDADLPDLTEEMREMVGQRMSRNEDVEDLPAYKVTLPTSGEFLAGVPNYSGRAVVLYFWHPELRRSYWPLMQQMDLLQRKYPRDVVVIGVMMRVTELEGGGRGSRRDRPNETTEELKEDWDRFTASRDFDHNLLFDPDGRVLDAISESRRGGRGTLWFPAAFVFSTDSALRWAGTVQEREYQSALDTILARDPAILARRKAEREYIEGKR